MRVRWGNSRWCSRGRCSERGLYELIFEFIEGRETRDKVVKFGGVGITDEEVVNNKEKRGGVGVVAEEHGGEGFGVAVSGKEGDKTKLGQETRLRKAGDSLKNITE